MLKRILHANDGSEGAFKALAMALDLAKKYNAELHMICVEEISNFPEMIADVKQEKGHRRPPLPHVVQRAEDGRPAPYEVARPCGRRASGAQHRRTCGRAKVDLLVIGATGHSAFYERMIGSRADRLVQLGAVSGPRREVTFASCNQEESRKLMASYFWIAIGSALGGMARYWCSGVAARMIGETFPWGTLIVNVVGSFIIGFFATLTGPDGRVFVGSRRAAIRDDRLLRRLHHVFLVQPADAQSHERRRMAAGGSQYRRLGDRFAWSPSGPDTCSPSASTP